MNEYKNLIEKGDEKINKEMDMIKILKRIRKLKFISKQHS